ncbi:MAG TPA: hypothetical protein VIY48_07515, partial [Candidatus Paceibacterota bacterium]
LAGLALDIGTDPTVYLSGGTTLLARDAAHASAIAAGRRTIEAAPARFLGKFPEKARFHAFNDASVLHDAGPAYRHRAALAKLQAEKLGKPLDIRDNHMLVSLREQAIAEEKAVEKFLPKYKIFGHDITPTTLGGKKAEAYAAKAKHYTPHKIAVGGKQLVPALPKLDNLVERGGIAGRAAKFWRESFIRDASHTAPTAKAAMVNKHGTEELTKNYLNFARHHLEGMARTIKTQRQREVLHLFEAKGAKIGNKPIRTMVKAGDRFEPNPVYVKHLLDTGKITSKEAEFVHHYNDIMEHLHINDKLFGVKVTHFSARTGRMYVPHMANFGEHQILNDAMKKLSTKAGFEQARGHRDLSLLQIHLAAQGKKLPESVITDPYQVLVGRVRASARRQADLAMLDSLARVGGVPTKLVKTEQLAKNRAEQDAARAARTALEKAHEGDLANAEKAVRAIKYGRKTKVKAANLAKAEKKLAALTSEHATNLVTVEKRIKALKQGEKDLLKGYKNPAFKKDMLITKALSEHGHPIAFHSDLGQAVNAVRKVIEGDERVINEMGTAWRKMISGWKLLVTTVNPGYRMRNTLSDAWAMYISGANAAQMGYYSMKSAQLMRLAKKAEQKGVDSLTVKEAKQLSNLADAYKHGIMSGLFEGDIQAVTRWLAYGGSKKGLAREGHVVKFVTKAMQDMNRNAENWGRLTHYLWLTDGKGFSPADAAFRVKRAHFDYEDLTTLERKKMKSFFPFYTWTRKNIPFQIKALVERPGKFATFPKVAQESQYAAGNDKGTILPGYIGDAFGFQVPMLGKHNYLLPQIGAADLQALDSPGGAVQRFSSLINPAYRLPAELLANRNLYTGGQIASDTHPRTPVSKLGAELLSLLPGSNVGGTSRIGPGGKHLYGPGANPYYVQALGNLGPLANLLLKKGSGIPSQQTPINPLWSYGLGLSIQHVDPAQQQMYAEIAASNAAKKRITGLRDVGAVPQAKHKKSKKSRYISQQIAKAQGRR